MRYRKNKKGRSTYKHRSSQAGWNAIPILSLKCTCGVVSSIRHNLIEDEESFTARCSCGREWFIQLVWTTQPELEPVREPIQ